MKRLIAMLLVLAIGLCLPALADEGVHKIGVIVYNTADDEVLGFKEYLKGYIEQNFEMVKFVYSGSIESREEELEFIQAACDSGVEGFMSFLTQDLKAEVALCEKNQAYYLLASGTVSAEDFEAVEENPWFLGMFGPGQPFEFQAGADMARFFIREKVGSRYFVLSGGAPLGNEMHYQRTLGILDTLSSAYGASFSVPREVLARTDAPITVATDRVSVTLCPGYISREPFLETARAAFSGGEYDAVLSVLPPAEMVSASAAMNAYNFDDLSRVTKIYNPDANLNELCALAEAYSYRAVQARRGTQDKNK